MSESTIVTPTWPCPPCTPEAVCSACEQCLACCTCTRCPACDAPSTEEVCSNCEQCEDCCECAVCQRGRCGARVESVCDRCERCEACCECRYCEDCEAFHNSDTSFCSDCDSCEDACTCDRTIYPYGEDVLEHLAFQGSPAGGLYLGVELEVECQGRSKSAKAEAVAEVVRDWAILKEDGSLNNGFEIVTAPGSVAVHVEHFTTLLNDTAALVGLTSYDTSTCGMHVHVSRKPISALTLGKLLVFMNSSATKRQLRIVAGRDSARWAKRHAKKVTDGAKADHDRYQALNLCNHHTIEFRIFKGTLHLGHVLANIEFVDAVVRWAMQVSIQDCENWSAFWAFATANGKTYKHLLAYCEAH